MQEKVLVTGATGKVGRELIPLLLEEGTEVTAGTRNPEWARANLPAGVEVVELNYDRTETYDHALTWADRVFLMPPPFSLDSDEAIGPFLDWAVGAKVEHIVLLSAMSVPEVDDLSLRKVERHLEAQDVSHTILRPNLYMQNFHPGFLSKRIQEDREVRLPVGKGRVSLVDVRDVAEVAARALTGDEHLGRSYTLTGPEALSMEEAVGMISEALGERVAFREESEDGFRALLEEEGWRAGELQVVLDFFRSIRREWRAPIHPEVEKILGRPPRTFADFAREAAPAWK